jgi:hypothetical protein
MAKHTHKFVLFVNGHRVIVRCIECAIKFNMPPEATGIKYTGPLPKWVQEKPEEKPLF